MRLELEHVGFTTYPEVKLNKTNTYSFDLFVSDRQIIFLIEDEFYIHQVRTFILALKDPISYLIVLKKGGEYYLNQSGNYIKLNLSEFVKDKSKGSNNKVTMRKFRDNYKKTYSDKRVINLEDGSRWIKKENKWCEALSEEESNKYLNSLLFLGPLGFHYIKYKENFLSYLKAFAYLLTGGFMGITTLDGLLMVISGKKIRVIEDDEVVYKWAVPTRGIDNMKKVLLAIPYTIAIIGVVYLLLMLGIKITYEIIVILTGGIKL